MENSDFDTFIYDSSDIKSQKIMLKVEQFDQSKNEIGNIAIVIYHTNCDSVLNKMDELQLEIEMYTTKRSKRVGYNMDIM